MHSTAPSPATSRPCPALHHRTPDSACELIRFSSTCDFAFSLISDCSWQSCYRSHQTARWLRRNSLLHPDQRVSTLMPIFFKRKNERSSTFVHLALWRQQLFMHTNMHDEFSDAQCGVPDTAHQGGAPTHQKGGIYPLLQCTFRCIRWAITR